MEAVRDEPDEENEEDEAKETEHAHSELREEL